MMSRLPGSSPKVLHSKSAMRRQAGKRLQVAGVTHVGDQADEIVFVRPDVPFRPAIRFQVRAQIAVGELALDQFGGDVIQLLAQRRVAGVDPGQRRGVQPFADVLAVPGLAARPFAVPFQQAVGSSLARRLASLASMRVPIQPFKFTRSGICESCRSGMTQATFSGTGVIAAAARRIVQAKAIIQKPVRRIRRVLPSAQIIKSKR